MNKNSIYKKRANK